jgi:hypothetical protein
VARNSSSFNRAKPSRKQRPKVLVICEDLKSGKQYIEDAAIYYRVKVAVEVIHIGKTDPTNILDEAIKRSRDYDRVFCTIDRDNHEKWDAALRLIEGKATIEAITSFPCFEYWLILHFNANRKPYGKQGNKSPGECCADDLRQCNSMQGYDKGKHANIFKTLLSKLDTAKRNAKRVLADAEKTKEWNPSTRFHVLIEYLGELEKEIDN